MSPYSKKTNSKILQTSKSDPEMSMAAHAAFAKFEATKTALVEFIDANRRVLDDYKQHIKDYEEAIAEVSKAYLNEYEAIGESYAGFSVSKRRKLKVDELLKLHPDAAAYVRTEYKMNLSELDAAIKDGGIPEELYSQVVEMTLSIEAPKKL